MSRWLKAWTADRQPRVHLADNLHMAEKHARRSGNSVGQPFDDKRSMKLLFASFASVPVKQIVVFICFSYHLKGLRRKLKRGLRR
jgi:hypothetical protein